MKACHANEVFARGGEQALYQGPVPRLPWTAGYGPTNLDTAQFPSMGRQDFATYQHDLTYPRTLAKPLVATPGGILSARKMARESGSSSSEAI
jgi:hypothetical protein